MGERAASHLRRLAGNAGLEIDVEARQVESSRPGMHVTVWAEYERVAEATDQVRLTTQQQRAATEQVVQAMGQANEASRQVSVTTQEVAGGSEALTLLAASLEASAAATAARL